MIKKLFIFLIRLYQYTVSPLLGLTCRFYPSCSEYMILALQKHGILKGVYLGTKRICRCHPWNPGGHDPVP
jgi:putative membrane protein insertion efficiency factor